MSDNERKSSVKITQLAEDLAIVRQGRILFSHHSVGANIITGIQQLDTEVAGRNHIHVISLDEATTSKGPMLIHVSGGQNGDPKSKIDFFAGLIRGQPQLKPDLAFMKLCFVDFNPGTNVDNLFIYYRKIIETLKLEHPEIRFAHITSPLTTWPAGLKWRMFRLIGKEVWEDTANMKRSEFNRRIKESFGADQVFDLARVEATTPDGRLITFEQGGKSYQSLYPGYTEDDGHLNMPGRQMAGAAAIHFMAEGIKSRSYIR